MENPLVIIETSQLPFSRINIDLLGVFNENYDPTIRDQLFKFSQAYAESVFKTLLLYFQHFGIFPSIHCGRGREFNKCLPQSNSPRERFHSTLLDIIRMNKFENSNKLLFNILQ